MANRPYTVSEEIEVAERHWWQEFAEIEDLYCWVQPPPIQETLRGHYLREIIASTKPGGRILELGCGTGWLCILLAKLGASKVVGLDFASAQIDIAKRSAKENNLADRALFLCMDGTSGELDQGKFDTVIVHGFLHHLTVKEIESTLASIPKLLAPGGAFIVFEPTMRPKLSNVTDSRWMVLMRKLRSAANKGGRLGLRRYSQQEFVVREKISRRPVGKPPHGPSPKEIGFEIGELESYLTSYFKVEKRVTCMAMSHLVVQEWLVRGISHPLSTKLMLPFVSRASAWLDQRLIGAKVPPNGIWTFDMFLCRSH